MKQSGWGVTIPIERKAKSGGGVALDLSNLREAGASIKGYEGAASGVVPVMKLYEDSFSYANQLGQRQGAGAVYLNIFHPDIIEFLSTKKENADEKIRVKTLSLGVTIPDKFYELARNNEDMYLFSPESIKKEYGVSFNYIDITEKYDELVSNPNIRKKKVSARALEEELSKLQQESGYPYVLNIDVANRANPAGGKVIMSNLCTEILQPMRESEINDDQTYRYIGKDVSCNLGSTNVTNMMSSPDFGKSIRTAIKALVRIADTSNVEAVPSIKNGNEMSKAVGLGAMSLAEYFAVNEIEYGSPESIEFTHVYFMLMRYWSLVESNHLAKIRNKKFVGFEESDYADGSFFDQYLTNRYIPKSEKVKELFKNHFIPTIEDWEELKEKVMKFGVYCSHHSAIAPTGSISYVQNATASLHPITQRVEERQEKKIGKIYYPMPGLSNKTMEYYQSAYDLDMRKVIDIYAAASEHIDQGLSLTLFMRSDIPAGLYDWKLEGGKMTTRDLTILRHYAYHKNIKSIYYIRTYTSDNDISGANECQNCSI